MQAHWLAVLFGGVWACVVGCGDSEGGAGDKDEFIASLCAEYSGCCEAAGRPSDGAQCRAFYGAFVSASSYDPTMAQACLTEVRARQDQCDVGSASAPSCAKVFGGRGGTKKPGEDCEDDDECAAPDAGRVECVSEVAAEGRTQKCQVRLTGEAGSSPCVGTVNGNVTYYSGDLEGIPPTAYLCAIADGLSCNGQTGACERLAAVGETCGGSECVESAYCDFTDGLCKERLAIGAACDDGQCVESAYCEGSRSTCAAHHAVGAACASDIECQSNECVNQKCAVADDLSLAFLCGSE
jgi:hypothetical protein